MPEVSIIMAAYNQAAYIAQAVQSVIDQTYEDWELIVIDDGSTDSTAQIMAEVRDPRVHYFHQVNSERSRARNRGLMEAKGRLIAFLDADDFWLTHYLARQVECLDRHPQAALSTTSHFNTDAAGAIVRLSRGTANLLGTREDVVRALLFGNRMASHSVVVRADSLNSVGGFDPELREGEDWDLWLRLAIRFPVAVVDEPLACYRRFNTFLPSRQLNRGAETASLKIIEKAFSSLSSSDLLALKPQVLAACHFRAAWALFALGQLPEARHRLTLARDLDPALFTPPYGRLVEFLAYLTDELYDLRTPLDEALFYLNRFFASVPEWAVPLQTLRPAVIGQYCGFQVFRWREGMRGDEIQRFAKEAIRYRPRWLLNRGFVSIVTRSYARSMGISVS